MNESQNDIHLDLPSLWDHSPGKFLDLMLSLDQADTSHSASPRIAEILQQPDVRQTFEKLSPEIRARFGETASIASLHSFQLAVFLGTDRGDNPSIQVAAAYVHAQKYLWNEHPWTRYVFGTLLYLEARVKPLQETIRALWGDPNAQILRGLLSGLERRKSPNYRADYFGL